MTPIFGFLASGLGPDKTAELEAYRAGQAGLGPVCDSDTQLYITGQPIWRGEVFGPSDVSGLARKLLDNFRAAGPKILDELEGPFALAFVEPNKNKAMLAIDRMGIERLTYATIEGKLVFGSSAGAVAGFPGFSKSLRNQSVYDFLFMHMVPAPQTIYEGIHKLPPATVLEFDRGAINVRRYWQPTYEESADRDLESLKISLLDGLRKAVVDSRPNDSTGAFLSGGLDSSSIVGTLAGLHDTPVKTFTVGFGDADDFDELAYSRVANRHFGCEAVEYRMTAADIVDAFPRIAEVFDEPFGNSSAAPTFFCAHTAAKNGIDHLLAGDGGDELFGGNERYVKQSIFEIYRKLPRWMRNRIVEPAARSVSANSRITIFRKARSYVDQAAVPLPERFETWNFMYRDGREQMLDPEFASSVDQDAPFSLMREVWASAPSNDLLDRMLWYDWRFTLADNDLRKVSTMCRLAGVRVSYPMLHPAVVDLSTKISSRMKIKGTDLRTFFKQAMADFLPKEILRKEKHGFGLPFGLWLKSDRDLAEMVYSLLTDLKQRKIIAAGFIDALIDQHREGHASYFGYAIWDLAMLEAWLARHIDHSG